MPSLPLTGFPGDWVAANQTIGNSTRATLNYDAARSVNPDASPDYQNQLEKAAAAQAAVEDYKRKWKSEASKSMQRANRHELEQRLDSARDFAHVLEIRLRGEETDLAKIEVVKDKEPVIPGKTGEKTNE